jgi:aminopeptidase N
MKKYLSLLFIALTICAQAQNTYRSYLKDNTSYREHPVDITRMKVEVSFDAPKGLVKGKVTHSFVVLQKQVDSVFFDGPGIDIKSAKINGSNLPFTTNAKGIWVKPTQALKPNPAKAFIL